MPPLASGARAGPLSYLRSMYSSVIVPIDGSGFGDSAVGVGESIARRLGGTLRLVHVVPPPAAAMVPQDSIPADPLLGEQLRVAGAAHLEKLVDDLREAGSRVSSDILEGDVESALLDYAGLHAPALVVLTTHGRGGMERAMLGSVADALVRRSSLPVLAIRPGAGAKLADDSFVDRVMLPLDGSHRDEEIFDHARTIGRAMTAEFLLVQVVEPKIDKSRPVVQQVDRVDLRERRGRAQEYLDRVAEHLRRYEATATSHVLVDDDVAGALIRFAADQRVDVVAMATRGRRGLDRFVAGSVADRVLRESGAGGVLLYRVE
jgi:nucleotide-binding universal stress UspA family protein